MNINNYTNKKNGLDTLQPDYVIWDVHPRKESRAHHALKKGVSAVIPLDSAFVNISAFLKTFEDTYIQNEIKESSRIDVIVSRGKRLKDVFLKISKRALICIREELSMISESEKNDFDGEDICMRYPNSKNFGLPCYYFLSKPNGRDIQVSDMPARWLLSGENEVKTEEPDILERPKPWMKYMCYVESAFRKYSENSGRMRLLMDGLDNLLSKME